MLKEQEKPFEALDGEHEANSPPTGWQAYHANSKTLRLKHPSNRSKKDDRRK